MRRLLILLVALSCVSVTADRAHAHKASDSYLRLTVTGERIEMTWDIALRDLEYAIGIDANADGSLTWGELRSRHADIAGYAFSRLQITPNAGTCSPSGVEHLVDRHTDGAYAVLKTVFFCSHPIEAIDLRYDLLFDLDPQHRGILWLGDHAGQRSFLFGPDQRSARFAVGVVAASNDFLEYWRDGIWHIFTGFDHVLFLLSLLIPAVLDRDGRRWRGSDQFEPVLARTLAVVTAFTVAHSVTLALTVFGLIALESRWVESAIAASVAIAGLNNLYPVLSDGRWRMAFAFGLLHGIGFAGALADPTLPASSMLVALLGFNLGVETGQIAVVLLFLPLAYTMRTTWFYRHVTVYAGSAVIVMLAFLWLVERLFQMRLIT